MAQKSKTLPPRDSRPGRDAAPKPSSGSTSPSASKQPGAKQQNAKQPAASRPRRWPLLLAAALVLLLAAVYFAPLVVALTPLRQQILPGLFPLLAVKSHVGSASLDWFTAVTLRDVQLTDLDGRPILDAPTITSRHTLASLILDQTHLGGFIIEKPVFHVVLRDDGNNIEDAIAPMIASTEPSTPREFSLEIDGGTIHVAQAAESGTWRFDGVKVSLDMPLTGKQFVLASAKLAPGDDVHGQLPPGDFSADVAWRMPLPKDQPEGDTGRALFDVSQLPLEAARPALRRFVGDMRLAGPATGKVGLHWNGATGRFEIVLDNLRSDALAVAAAALLAEDNVQVGEVRCSGGFRFQGGAIAVDKLNLETAPASIAVDGSVRPADFQNASLLDALFRPQVVTTGRVDLAKLAAMLPETLRIRAGTRITSGNVAWDLASREAMGKRRVVGRLDATSLAAEADGQTVAWEQPVQLTLAVEQSAQGPVVEQLECKSSFLDLRGSGTAREATLVVDCNLDKLAAELTRFVDLGELRLSGRLTSNIGWRRGDDGQMSAAGKAEISDLVLELPGARPWQEQRLTADFDTAGRFNDAGALRLDRAKAVVQSGEDLLDLELTEPIEGLSRESYIPLRGRLNGRLAAWLARVQMLLPLPGWQIDGVAALSAAGRVSLHGAELATIGGEVTQLAVQGNGLTIAEPRVVIDGKDVALDLSGGASFAAADATLACSAIAVRGTNLQASLPEHGPNISGKLSLRSDLNRITAWLHDPDDPSPFEFFGEAVGEVAVDVRQGVSSADVDVAVLNLTIAQRPLQAGAALEPLWREPSVRVVGKASYDHVHATAELDKLSVQSEALRVTATGKVSDLTERIRVDLDGDLECDLALLAPLARPYLGDDFQLQGKNTERFAVHGPLLAPPLAISGATAAGSAPANTAHTAPPGDAFVISPELTASAAIGWDAARVYELDVGRGRLETQLRDGVLRAASLDLPVSGGRVLLAPSILLNRQPIVLAHGPAQVIDHVQITPSMCRTWLKYVAPLMADATEVKGRFSTELDGAMVPLLQPLDGQVQGRLAVHAAEVGPGPLGREILLIARRVEHTVKGRPLAGLAQPASVWMTMPEQTIDFQVGQRRVRHSKLTFVVGDVTVQTAGTVGFDQSLDLVATIPMLDEWTKSPYLAGMRGKSLTIPVQGTLAAPKIDADLALQELTRSFLQGAPGRLIDDQLKKGLDKLFGPKQ